MDPFDRRVLELVSEDGRSVATRLSEELGISRQASSARIRKMVRVGLLVSKGTTSNRILSLAELTRAVASYPIVGLSEDIVWRELCAPVVADLSTNVRDIWHYGITEMVNNAIDHSGSVTVNVGMSRTALYTTGWVSDAGEGIFLKIQRALNLYDPREAILELAKGKFTTDPANHTGEGIFFSSKMFDAYDIRSRNLHFMHDAGELDVLAEREQDDKGTLVLMRLNNDSPRTDKEIFDHFSGSDDYTFDKTIVPVRLAIHEGEKLVSRSQAKRLTMRFERFRHVILDFDGVNEIGQAFADEVFRVFQFAHPNTIMVPVHMTQAVKAMVSRVTSV
jgi:DNA-binding Lrp family transcriptional regulator